MKTGRKETIIGYVCLILAVIIWGSSFVVLKDAIKTLPIFFVLGIRFFVPGILFLFVFFKRFLKFDKRSTFVGIALGVVLACAYLLQTLGLSMTTPSKNAFLSCTYCIFVPALAWVILKRKPTVFNIIASLLCFVGVGLICLTNGFKGINKGDYLTVACGVFYALQIVINEKFSKKLDIIKVLVIELIVAGGIFWTISLSYEIPKYPKTITTTQWLYLAYLMIACTAITQLLQLVGQKYANPEKVSILMCFEAVFATIFSFIFGMEEFNLQILFGFLAILASIIISETKLSFIIQPLRNRRAKNKEERVGQTDNAENINGETLENGVNEESDEKT